jgi:hypothetical protein
MLLAGNLLMGSIAAMAAAPGSYNSYGYGTGVHTISGSNAFPNFQNGAVNNHYPLAQVQQDASPSSTAVATYSDSGPLTATGGSQYNQSCSAGNPPPPPSLCQNPNNNVPYATSRYPGGPGKAHVDSCSPSYASSHQNKPCPGGDAASRGDSDAAQLDANATGFYAGGGAQPFSGASGESHTTVSADGTLTVTTHSEVENFGFGNVKVNKVVVDTTATSNGSTATADAHVVVGEVTVNGQPVNVTDQGLTVQQKQPLPCPSAPVPAPSPPAPVPAPVPSPPAPGVLPSPPQLQVASYSCVPGVDVTYVRLFTAKPDKKVAGSHGTASATGLHVVVTHPAPGPGVPQQSTEYVLGEGFADAGAGSGSGGAGSFPFGGGFFGFDGSGFDQFGVGGGGGSGGSGITSAILANRLPLALLFFTLEALVLGAAAAWVWARNAPAELVVDEVLTP